MMEVQVSKYLLIPLLVCCLLVGCRTETEGLQDKQLSMLEKGDMFDKNDYVALFSKISHTNQWTTTYLFLTNFSKDRAYVTISKTTKRVKKIERIEGKQK